MSIASLKQHPFKGYDPNFEVNIFEILKVATNETSTLHQATCTWIAFGIYNNDDQQFNRPDFVIKFSLMI